MADRRLSPSFPIHNAEFSIAGFYFAIDGCTYPAVSTRCDGRKLR
jgi:hypothetical protein